MYLDNAEFHKYLSKTAIIVIVACLSCLVIMGSMLEYEAIFYPFQFQFLMKLNGSVSIKGDCARWNSGLVTSLFKVGQDYNEFMKTFCTNLLDKYWKGLSNSYNLIHAPFVQISRLLCGYQVVYLSNFLNLMRRKDESTCADWINTVNIWATLSVSAVIAVILMFFSLLAAITWVFIARLRLVRNMIFIFFIFSGFSCIIGGRISSSLLPEWSISVVGREFKNFLSSQGVVSPVLNQFFKAFLLANPSIIIEAYIAGGTLIILAFLIMFAFKQTAVDNEGYLDSIDAVKRHRDGSLYRDIAELNPVYKRLKLLEDETRPYRT